MTEQPPETGDETEARKALVRRRTTRAYKLAVMMVTARNDRETLHTALRGHLDDQPSATFEDVAEMARMLAATTLILTDYVRVSANAMDRLNGESLFDRIHSEAINPEWMEE
jgi:hypothetical protein